MICDYTTAELGLMLVKHQERRVILTQSIIKQIKQEIQARDDYNRDLALRVRNGDVSSGMKSRR